MDFPGLVFRCPGAHIGPGRSTYDYAGVKTQEQLAAKLAEGWFATLGEAVEASLPKAPPVVPSAPQEAVEEPIPGDDEPPTRRELEEKARELGIKFDGRTPDRKLAKSIAEAMGAKE